MKLWTWHQQDFSILTGRVEHSRSEYYQSLDRIPMAYAELFRRLGTDQIIWCYTLGTTHKPVNDGRFEWRLEVPTSKIIGFIDSDVWERMVWGKGTWRHDWERPLRMKAYDLFPNDPTAQGRYCDEAIQEYCSRQPPEGTTWWDHLFVGLSSGHGVVALIAHPVPKEWVLKMPSRVERLSHS